MIRPTAWGSDWFLSLSLPLRLAWQFVLQHADSAGFFEVDRHQHLLRLSCDTPLAAVQRGLAAQVVVLSPTLWQVKGYVAEQYPRDYECKLNGVQMRALKTLRHRASQFGQSVYAHAFPGCAPWPEVGAKAEGGGVDPGTEEGGPPAQAGSTGKALQGGALQGLTPPVSTKKASTEDAESKGVMLTPDALVIAALAARWTASGYVAPDWPPFTQRAVLEAARAYGADAVDLAARAFLEKAGDNRTPKRLGNELGDWLRTVPADKRHCLGPHTFEGALLPLKPDYPNGPMLRAKVCGWCGHREYAQGTLAASTERQPCDHPKVSACTMTWEGGPAVGTPICEACGEIMAEVTA